MLRRLPPALAAGLVLADSSVVTLALPDILRDLDTSVAGVAWVLVAFNLALAVAAVPGAALARRRPGAAYGAGLLAFAAACLACAAAGGLGALVAARAAQGVAGAVVVAAALELLRAERPQGALATWTTAGVLGAAVGPAAGGLLTQAFSWQAMFGLQAPVALLALTGALRAAPGVRPVAAGTARDRPSWPALAALALASAALAAALFLLVTMIIEGWRRTPAEAALTVTVMPVAALLAPRALRGIALPVRAACGAILLAGGLAGLGLLPGASDWWTVAPQVLVGAGLGLLVGALTVAAVGGGEGRHGASLAIAARHAGVVAGLLLLTPVFTADLQTQRARTERAGLSDLLDADLPLAAKVRLARSIDDVARAADGRLPDLAPAFADADPGPGRAPALRALQDQLDEQLDRAGTAAFARSFRAAALLALLALAPLALLRRRRTP